MASSKAGQGKQGRRERALDGIQSALGEHSAEDVFLGIDLGTEENTTALAAIYWPDGGPGRLIDIWPKVWHGNLVHVMNGRNFAVAAVDVPLGWPEGFRRMVEAHAKGTLKKGGFTESEVEQPPVAPGEPGGREWRTELMAMRETDRRVAQVIQRKPLSVSFDKLGAVTASWALIEAHLTPTPDRSGRKGQTPRIIETYPAAQISLWSGGDKKRLPVPEALKAVEERHGIDLRLDQPTLREKFHARASHGRDATVCAVVASLAGRGAGQVEAMLPPDVDVPLEVQQREGVMWLDVDSPTPSSHR